MNILKKIEKPLLASFFVVFFLCSLFDRSFIGLYIMGFRLGELIVGFLFLFTILFALLNKNLIRKLNLESFTYTLRIYKIIIITFAISLIYFQTSFTSTYTYKTSSYIWMSSLAFLSYYLFTKTYTSNKYLSLVIYIYALLPIIHYLFSSGYYPDFIMSFFMDHSDKFNFTKASDIMIVSVIASLVLFNTEKNKQVPFIYFAAVVPLLLPLLLEMSRGSFVGAAIFYILVMGFNWRYLFSIPRFTIILILISASTFIFSTYRISGIEFNASQKQEVVVMDTSLAGGIKKIAKKNDTRKAFFSFYIEDGRLVSDDNTTDWRLDIWQDVIEDLNNKDSVISGYGYNEIIPVMTDPTAPGRLGRDGLNENVHSYIFNILARGGIVQLFLFITFHLSFVLIWYKKYKNFDILLLMVPVFINSATDMNMEGVQFPFMYYFFLGIYFKLYKNDLNNSSI